MDGSWAEPGRIGGVGGIEMGFERGHPLVEWVNVLGRAEFVRDIDAVVGRLLPVGAVHGRSLGAMLEPPGEVATMIRALVAA